MKMIYIVRGIIALVILSGCNTMNKKPAGIIINQNIKRELTTYYYPWEQNLSLFNMDKLEIGKKTSMIFYNGFEDRVQIKVNEEIVFDKFISTNREKERFFLGYRYRYKKKEKIIHAEICLPEKNICVDVYLDFRYPFLRINRIDCDPDGTECTWDLGYTYKSPL